MKFKGAMIYLLLGLCVSLLAIINVGTPKSIFYIILLHSILCFKVVCDFSEVKE